jgi:hypothetical protein
LFCYDFVNKITNEDKIVLLATEPNLFTIGTIILPESEILVVVAANAKFGINAKINRSQKR